MTYLVGRVEMSGEQFEAMTRVLGWKYEYFLGAALITPRSCPVAAVIKLQSSEPHYSELEGLTRSEASLVELYVEAFAPTVEYAGYSIDRVRERAVQSLNVHFQGQRGLVRPESKVFRVDGQTVGAALIVQKAHGPHLDLLMVAPARHRTGIATSLLAAVSQALLESGEKRLTSAYQLANLHSRNWHLGAGFKEIPNHYSEQVRLRHLVRNGGSEVEIAASRMALNWLEELAEQHGADSVHTVNRILLPGDQSTSAPEWLRQSLDLFCET